MKLKINLLKENFQQLQVELEKTLWPKIEQFTSISELLFHAWHEADIPHSEEKKYAGMMEIIFKYREMIEKESIELRRIIQMAQQLGKFSVANQHDIFGKISSFDQYLLKALQYTKAALRLFFSKKFLDQKEWEHFLK